MVLHPAVHEPASADSGLLAPLRHHLIVSHVAVQLVPNALPAVVPTMSYDRPFAPTC